MIVARLTPTEDASGRRYLEGQTTSAWPLPLGTKLMLRKVGESYELVDCSERPVRFTPEALGSFLDRELCGEPQAPGGRNFYRR